MPTPRRFRGLRPKRRWHSRLPVAVLLGLTLVVPIALVSAPAAAASASTAFAAVITEEFCEPGGLDLCGTAATSEGRATVHTVITGFVPAPGGCFHDEHTSTLTFGDASTVVVAIAGTLCPTAKPPNFTLEGTYTVTGGTLRFAGATGAGSVRGFRQNGPVHEVLQGTLSVLGAAG